MYIKNGMCKDDIQKDSEIHNLNTIVFLFF